MTAQTVARFDRLRERLRRGLERLLFRLDTTNFIIDRPALDYQPLPWAGVPSARIRGQATLDRWEDLAKRLPSGDGLTALDVGCCYGFFSVRLAQRGYRVLGIDLDPRCVRIARYATPAHLRGHCNFIEAVVTPDDVPTPAHVDCTLALSVWHHWVQQYGLAAATHILQTLWERTRQALVFESGEGEVIDEFRLPFGAENARLWLGAYLRETCMGGQVEMLAEHRVGSFSHYTDTAVKRGLFLVTRPAGLATVHNDRTTG